MKQSSRILLVSIVGILIIVVAMVIAARGMVNRIMEGGVSGENAVELSGERDSREYALEGFATIVTDGAWQVDIVQADVYEVRVTADESVLSRLDLDVDGEELRLDMPGNLPIGGLDVRAEIRMPDLDRVETKGGADVRIRDFTLGRLEIRSEGAANVLAENSSIDTLELDTDGASNIDFSDSRTVHADLAVEGAANVELTMAGGRLTGYLGGIGQVSYGGEVSEESVDVRGLGGVDRR